MSEEKGYKGLSLRRKKTTKPTISAPRQISQPTLQKTTSHSSQWDDESHESRPPLGSRENTSDLVKRRYSTRFIGTGIGQDGLVPPVPTVPALPSQIAPSTRIGATKSPVSRAEKSQESAIPTKVEVDLHAMTDPDLQAEHYVQTLLAEASESDIRAYQGELQNLKQQTSTDLQNNVYQNRTQFIKISKEADKLKSEMQTLRTLMSELTGALGSAVSVSGVDPSDVNRHMTVSERKRANRSSVANLEAMWSSHLQVLWKRVEGSQKHLPALPGRHIIMESQRWVELNAATWKPRRRVALVLLNDHLLVASEKKRNDMAVNQAQQNGRMKNRQSVYQPGPTAQSQSRLMTERCWPLQDVSLVDIGRSSTAPATDREKKTIANAILIRSAMESFTFAVADSSEKASIIIAFRKAQEDLRKQLVAEHGPMQQHASVADGQDPYALRQATAIAPSDVETGDLNRNDSIIIDSDGRQQTVRWVESQLDGLDINIALQHFEEAVDRIERLRRLTRGIKGNATAQDIIFNKVNQRAVKLANNISRQLVHTSAKLEQTRQNVAWLIRLGFEELARTQYLKARTDVITLRVRQLPFTGAPVPYLHALSFTIFTLLLNTIRNFQSSFPTIAGSAVVSWAKERVDDFNDILRRQLSDMERSSPLWKECMETVHRQADMLSEVGVDFKDLIGKDFNVHDAGRTKVMVPQGLGVSTN